MTNIQPELKSERSIGAYLATVVLVISLIFVAITFYELAKEARHEQEWISHATDVQVTSQQLAKSAGEAASGNLDAFLELGNSRSTIAAAMGKLRSGSVSDNLPPTPKTVAGPMSKLNQSWQSMSSNASSILDREKLILELAAARNIIQDNIPGIQKNTDTSIRALTKSGAPTNQVIFASRQLVLADRILRRVSEVLQGGSNAVNAAKNLANDQRLFEQVITSLLRGNSELRVTRVRNTEALQSLGKVKTLFETIKPQIDTILGFSDDLFEVRGAADEIFLGSREVFDEAANLKKVIAQIPQTRWWPSLTVAFIILAVMVLMVWILVYSLMSAERRRAKRAAKSNKLHQEAILRLLDEMSSLADGDLTVQATVSEDITGAIADAVNFAIEQLRELVKGIEFTAQEVAGSAMTTRTSTSELAKASAEQAEQVGEATKTVQKMAESFDTMARRSSESSEVAHKSVEIAHTGGKKVRETIDGMDTIREQIQGTSKRIKRLGESSQEIGDIVELINGFAEQTNVLALNAAIQAASAGGAGKGFAVVADEVQQLAESATQSTRRIESLVQTIQADTFEAVVSMESTISEVVSGAQLAEDAGTALEHIERVSNDLSKLIANISEEAHQQSANATDISALMISVQELSIQASEGSALAARSVEELAELVMQLSESVTDFKLPDDD
ncbi:MAG: methyl-accepting chemotaxis protein [Xanthomonadales bacterium]|nr:methyl-accepting chemotaxis protein [Xanthomonadales bacterium]